MDSVYLYDRWYGHIRSAGWDEVTSQTECVCDHLDQPDEGIWEARGGARKFLYSRLMCWVAMERAVRLAIRRGSPTLRAFVHYEGGDVVDAAVLCRADQPRRRAGREFPQALSHLALISAASNLDRAMGA